MSDHVIGPVGTKLLLENDLRTIDQHGTGMNQKTLEARRLGALSERPSRVALLRRK